MKTTQSILVLLFLGVSVTVLIGTQSDRVRASASVVPRNLLRIVQLIYRRTPSNLYKAIFIQRESTAP